MFDQMTYIFITCIYATTTTAAKSYIFVNLVFASEAHNFRISGKLTLLSHSKYWSEFPVASFSVRCFNVNCQTFSEYKKNCRNFEILLRTIIYFACHWKMNIICFHAFYTRPWTVERQNFPTHRLVTVADSIYMYLNYLIMSVTPLIRFSTYYNN